MSEILLPSFSNLLLPTKENFFYSFSTTSFVNRKHEGADSPDVIRGHKESEILLKTEISGHYVTRFNDYLSRKDFVLTLSDSSSHDMKIFDDGFSFSFENFFTEDETKLQRKNRTIFGVCRFVQEESRIELLILKRGSTFENDVSYRTPVEIVGSLKVGEMIFGFEVLRVITLSQSGALFAAVRDCCYVFLDANGWYNINHFFEFYGREMKNVEKIKKIIPPQLDLCFIFNMEDDDEGYYSNIVIFHESIGKLCELHTYPGDYSDFYLKGTPPENRWALYFFETSLIDDEKNPVILDTLKDVVAYILKILKENYADKILRSEIELIADATKVFPEEKSLRRFICSVVSKKVLPM